MSVQGREGTGLRAGSSTSERPRVRPSATHAACCELTRRSCCSTAPLALNTVASGTTVTVNCSSDAWATDGFSLAVTATAGSLTGCAGSDNATAAVTRIPKPTVTITGSNSVSACAQSGATLTYTVSSSTSAEVSVVATPSDSSVTCSPASSSGEESVSTRLSVFALTLPPPPCTPGC